MSYTTETLKRAELWRMCLITADGGIDIAIFLGQTFLKDVKGRSE
jgi:hypothetical protein